MFPARLKSCPFKTLVGVFCVRDKSRTYQSCPAIKLRKATASLSTPPKSALLRMTTFVGELGMRAERKCRSFGSLRSLRMTAPVGKLKMNAAVGSVSDWRP